MLFFSPHSIQPIREGYAAHLQDLMEDKRLSVPAQGPISSSVLRFNAADCPASRSEMLSPQRPVFFDLPPSTGDTVAAPEDN